MQEQEFSFKSFFIPLTTAKAIRILILVGLVVYFNMLFNGFVWDDIVYILINPEIHTHNPFLLFGHNVFNSNGYYRPIPAMYFSLLYMVFQGNTFFFHLIQIALHTINTIFVFLLFKKFFQNKIALLVSLVFLIHPMQVESVSYISAAVNVLFFTFGISSLLLIVYRKLRKLDYLFIFVLYLLALLTKESGIMFLIFGLVYSLIFIRKIFPKIAAVSFLVGVIYGVIRFVSIGRQVGIEKIVPIASLSLLQRLYT